MGIKNILKNQGIKDIDILVWSEPIARQEKNEIL
jgi:arabinogalactan endo-1,4-beta-galactosidase